MHMHMSETTYRPPEQLRSVAVIGTGSVGASWTSLFLAKGLTVWAYDPAPDAPARARAFIDNAWPALQALGLTREATAPHALLQFTDRAADAARQADLVQENVFEKLALKAAVLEEIGQAAGPDRIIISSTGGIPPSQLQAHCPHPERLVVVHPFNPSHLMPLVEVVGGQHTAPAVVDWALAFCRWMGKKPIELHVEAAGHMTNRLQFALVREAMACLLEGVASAQDIDAAVRYGLAPRWSLMGGLMTLHLAGGPGGMQGILDHAGAAIEQWWTPQVAPHLSDPQVKARLVQASAELAAGEPIAQWVQWRDQHLIEVLNLQAQSRRDEPGAQEAA